MSSMSVNDRFDTNTMAIAAATINAATGDCRLDIRPSMAGAQPSRANAKGTRTSDRIVELRQPRQISALTPRLMFRAESQAARSNTTAAALGAPANDANGAAQVSA